MNTKLNCYNCIYMREVPGNAHIRCVNPDPNMRGDKYGISNGWFIYPSLFDPILGTKKCVNFERKEEATS